MSSYKKELNKNLPHVRDCFEAIEPLEHVTRFSDFEPAQIHSFIHCSFLFQTKF